jgi:regulatory protein
MAASLDGDVAASADAAYAAALRLLTVRARSRAELEQRLTQRGFEPDAVAQTLERLGAAGLVDDDAFAAALAESRAARGMDAAVVALELRERGVDPTLAARKADQAMPAADRVERCRQVAEARLAQLGGLSPTTQARRLAAYLARRGYATEVIRSVVGDLLEFE